MQRIFLCPILAALSVLPGGAAPAKVISIATERAAPDWAVMERRVLGLLDQAGVEFVRTYTNPDGTLRWKERYEGGMNSSDDAYEAFRGMSLAYALGGSPELDRLHRWVWEGITRQFTRYGEIYREFDSNWDWMHHGEGYTSFYTLGLANPRDPKFRDRSQRFAALYTGDDEEAANYDPDNNLIRAVMTGSRGPKMKWTTRDWIPTNANLAYYQLPFDDIPGVQSPVGWINDATFASIVQTMSDRMARGDVPINLTVTPLMADAFLYSGEAKYKDWVLRYLQGWVDRTEQNDGITPDNVGLNGKVGEYTNGNWWGGYYGWKWPRGGLDIVRATLTAGKVAMLLTGDPKWLELSRSQMAVMRDHGRVENGELRIASRHDQRGWYKFDREPVYPYVQMWLVSQDLRDWAHIERIAAAHHISLSGGAEAGHRAPDSDADLEWMAFLKGRNPGFPVQAFQADFQSIQKSVDAIRREHGDPDTWVDNKWSNMDPMAVENLVRLTLGGAPIDIRGEMLHARLRYFDAAGKRPGLPPDVAALVTRMDADRTDVELVNLSLTESRRVIVQGGAYGEHRIERVKFGGRETAVGAAFFEAELAPGTGASLELGMKRYANQPSYSFPWEGR